MRKFFTLMFAVMFAGQALAQTSFEVNGLKYTITDAEKHEVSVGIISDDNKPQGNLIIPAEVENDGVKFAVTDIGYRAFYDCTGLTSITIPNSVKNIDYLAFQNCVSLTSVTIPNSVTNIGSTAFADCQKLTEIKVDGDNSTYTSENGVLLSKGRDILICCPIGKTGPYTIPESVKKIGNYAFFGCSGLTSVTIPNSVTTIGDYAFDECSSLTKAEFASVESLCKMKFDNYSSNPLTYANHLYINGEEVTEVSIPNSITSIGDYTFSGCSSLTSVNIPGSVTTIGDGAFEDCNNLTSVNIPDSVTRIGDSAFSGCSGLTSVAIPNLVTSIGYSAFHNCSGLTSVTIPNSVTSIGDYTFQGCECLTSVTIPNSVKSIGEDAFGFCYNLTSINIPDSVTTIGKYAFYDCINLTSVKIPNSIKEISDYMFDGCCNLSKVSMSDSITRIGQQAFSNCHRLSLAIPSSVKTIGLGAFDYVANIIYTGNVEGSEALTVNGIIDGDFIYSDAERTNLTAYIGEGGDVVIPDGVIRIGEMVFRRSKLSSVIIGNSVISIGVSAFEGCSCLTSVTLGESVKSIGSWAFGICTGLTSITIPKSVIKMGSRIFEGDQNLTIYCEVSSKPEDWASDWNCYDFGKNFCTVVWAGRTPVTEMAANAVNIYAYGNTIVVENATDEINVYNVMGTLVCRNVARNVSTVAESGVRTELQVNGTGVYIVKVGNIAKQVMVND